MVKIITQDQFEEKVANYLKNLDGMTKKSQKLDEEIQTNLRMIKYE